MSTLYRYTWKHEISILSKRQLEFPQPLLSGMIFADLLNGKAYRVHSVFKAKEHDRFVEQMPDDVVQTFTAGTLSEDDLTALRKKHKYEVQEGYEPNADFALLE